MPSAGPAPRVPASRVRHVDAHRLLPSRHLPHGDSVLTAIADDDAHLQAIFELDGATDDRLLAADERLPGIGLEELVVGIPHARDQRGLLPRASARQPLQRSRSRRVVRGIRLETAQAEVAFHRTVQLAEIGRFEDAATYDDYLADFSAPFHDLRKARGRQRYLNPESYVASQALAEEGLAAGALGIVYPSVRRIGGTCLACFRPALVMNVRRGKSYRFAWTGEPEPAITLAR